MTQPRALRRPSKRHSALALYESLPSCAKDDIIAHLAPATALATLNSSSGAVRQCLDRAASAEADFARRAAAASRTVWEWVTELGGWSWPCEEGSAGFRTASDEQKLVQKRPLPEDVNAADNAYIGSLRAIELTRREQRLEEVQRDLDSLTIEDLKTHVLRDHILPLSQSASSLSSSSQSGSSSSCSKMEDLTAVVTAILLQMLPELSKLTHLLRLWSIRLAVLRCIAPLTQAMEDAEAALDDGWRAIDHQSKTAYEIKSVRREKRREINTNLARKVTRVGRMLDYLLDCLDGMPDTLPVSWLQRTEAVETGYCNWIAQCELLDRQGAWTKPKDDTGETYPPSSVEDSARAGNSGAHMGHSQNVNGESTDSFMRDVSRGGDKAAQDERHRSEQESTCSNPVPRMDRHKITGGSFSRATGSISGCLLCPSDRTASRPQAASTETSSLSDTTSGGHFVDEVRPCALALGADDQDEDDGVDVSPLSDRGFEAALPRLPFDEGDCEPYARTPQRDGLLDDFGTPSSDAQLEVPSSPPLPRRMREAGPVHVSRSKSLTSIADTDQGMDSNPPPALQESPSNPKPRASLGEEPVLLNLLADASFADDSDPAHTSSEAPESRLRRESIGDQKLRQQISEIVESIPAKIRLSTEPSAACLSPSEIATTRVEDSSKQRSLRTDLASIPGSTSRAATPSFTLTPARQVRTVRQERGHPKIKVYHLSRSNGEPPIKLFIRCVGERGERVMVRVGGGWADLGEYLKEYASHHGRRSFGTDQAKVEVRDVADVPAGSAANLGSSPSYRPRPPTPVGISSSPSLVLPKTRGRHDAMDREALMLRPNTPAAATPILDDAPPSAGSARSSPSCGWGEDDSSLLGLAGPSGRRIEMSDENRAWVQSVKEKVRLVSGERRPFATDEALHPHSYSFGELGQVGATKRLFRKAETRKR